MSHIRNYQLPPTLTIQQLDEAYPITSLEELEDLLGKLDIIRMYIPDTVNYGHQAADIALITRVKELGFKGIFHIIYDKEGVEKLSGLFKEPISDHPHYYSENNQIQFTELSYFYMQKQQGKVPKVFLGLSARELHFANEMLAVSYQISFDWGIKIWSDSNHYFSLDDRETSTGLYFNYPSLDQIQPFIEQHDYAETLKKLVTIIKNKNCHVFSMYGCTLKSRMDNAINFILGSVYAHNKLTLEEKMPLIIPAYFDIDLNALNQAINHLNWDEVKRPILDNIKAQQDFYEELNRINDNEENNCETFNPNIPQLDEDTLKRQEEYINKVNKVIKQLSLPGNLLTTSLSDKEALQTITNLHPDQVLIIKMGSLPKKIFDALFTYKSSNIFMPVREGESTLNALLSNAVPHFRCGNGLEIKPYFSKIESTKKCELVPIFLEKLTEITYLNSKKLVFENWANYNLDELIGEVIIAAKKDPIIQEMFSDISQYIKSPENDRIRLLLRLVFQIKAIPQEKLDVYFSKKSEIINEENENKNNQYKAIVDAKIDAFLKQACKFAKYIVDGCPSYYPPLPTYQLSDNSVEKYRYWSFSPLAAGSIFNKGSVNVSSQQSLPIPPSPAPTIR